MQPVTERRTHGTTRVPVNGVVEVEHNEHDLVFEADAVNLGAGGASLRAAYLPEVGARLSWRYLPPGAHGFLEADSEVVWAESMDAETSQFGIRFLSFAPGTEEALGSLLRPGSNASVSGDEGDPPPSDDTETGGAEPSTLTRLSLEGVATPIVTRVVTDDPRGLVVEQELPFLRMGKGVLVESTGRQAKLESAELYIDGDVPTLLLSLRYDRAAGPQSMVDVAKGDRPAVGHDTLPGILPSECEDPAGDDWSATEDDARTSARRADTGGVQQVLALADEPELDIDENAARSERADQQVCVFRPAWSAQRSETAVSVASGSAVHVRRLVTRVLGIGATLAALFWNWGPRVFSGVRAGARLAVAFTRALFRTRDAQVPSPTREQPRRAEKPRVTAPPPVSSNLDGFRRTPLEQVHHASPRSRRPGAAIGITAVAVGLCGSVVYFVWPRAAVERSEPTVASDVSTATPLSPVVAAAAPAALPVPVLASPGPGPVPRPESTPSASPYAVDVRREDVAGRDPTRTTPTEEVLDEGPTTRSFGAAGVPGGRTFALRMSRTISGIQGTEQAQGFSVTIPGSLSLDPAAPISAANPMVRRAMILNYGDHSVLTIRFAEGRRPAYRVQAHGSTLEVILGR